MHTNLHLLLWFNLKRDKIIELFHPNLEVRHNDYRPSDSIFLVVKSIKMNEILPPFSIK